GQDAGDGQRPQPVQGRQIGKMRACLERLHIGSLGWRGMRCLSPKSELLVPRSDERPYLEPREAGVGSVRKRPWVVTAWRDATRRRIVILSEAKDLGETRSFASLRMTAFPQITRAGGSAARQR